ncbi:MAG: hypothetical protein ACREAA_08555 [Candidatus Polarisedimenticolia bacterium]
MKVPRSTRTYRCSPSQVRDAMDEIRAMGGTVTGSESEGEAVIPTPLGKVEGRYTFDGEELNVTLTHRPAMVPESLIWERLDEKCGPPVGRA